MQYILESKNVTFKSIINYPEIKITEKKTTFLQGPSGCGKSTLFRLFNETLSPDCGEIFYNGNNLETIDTILLRQNVLLAGQSVYLFQGTILENFKQYYGYRGLTMPSEEDIQYFLSLCCSDFPLDATCDSMSGGERQRIYVAICLSFMPKVLMLDEPTSALDNLTSQRFFKSIKDFCNEKGITLLAISHDVSLAEKYADEIIYLEGRSPL